MDLLVKLYDLDADASTSPTQESGIVIRRAMAYEKSRVTNWVTSHFGEKWGDECAISFSRQPIACHIALKGNDIIGFSCFESTFKNYFGPMGIHKDYRGRDIGKTLLLNSLLDLRALGYSYAIIGGCTGVEAFYHKTVNAIPIPDSTPGAYPKE